MTEWIVENLFWMVIIAGAAGLASGLLLPRLVRAATARLEKSR